LLRVWIDSLARDATDGRFTPRGARGRGRLLLRALAEGMATCVSKAAAAKRLNTIRRWFILLTFLGAILRNLPFLGECLVMRRCKGLATALEARRDQTTSARANGRRGFSSRFVGILDGQPGVGRADLDGNSKYPQIYMRKSSWAP
jgi:hypothetical protein